MTDTPSSGLQRGEPGTPESIRSLVRCLKPPNSVMSPEQRDADPQSYWDCWRFLEEEVEMLCGLRESRVTDEAVEQLRQELQQRLDYDALYLDGYQSALTDVLHRCAALKAALGPPK